MKKTLIAIAALLAVIAFPAVAGEWHSGTSNVCTDCHTMHFSQSHKWGDATPISTTPVAGGDWLSANGPNNFLLKDTANNLCLACHDGQGFAPDVLAANANTGPAGGRSAGALNETAAIGGYQSFMGHTLGSTTTPPGFNPALIGAPPTWYDPAGGLECISCHAQHGPTTAYRNLGPYSLGGAATAARPTYVISASNTTSADVWINIAAQTGTVGSRTASDFNPYYDSANVSFNRNDTVVNTITTSNRMDTFCGACHGSFHGGFDATSVAGSATPASIDGFIRHPTSGVTIGASTFGGHSSLSRYTGQPGVKTKVYASDRVAFADAAPGCVSCHKAHGNQNPFGLVFASHGGATPNPGYVATGYEEEGNYNTASSGYQQGYRNLCGQCHGQGN